MFLFVEKGFRFWIRFTPEKWTAPDPKTVELV